MNANRPLTVQTIDYHTGGEPFRIVTGGIPPVGGTSVPGRRRWIAERLDHVRQLLVNEPRGHADMYGGFVVPPDDDGADLGVVFFHNAGYSTACGHGTIALATWAVEHGIVPADGPVTQVIIDVPSGRLPTEVHLQPDGSASQVVFTNVPSFVKAHVRMDVEGRQVEVDVAFGGAFYAILPAQALGLSISPAELPTAIRLCRAIKDALNSGHDFVHPTHEHLRDVYGVILVEEEPDADDGSLRQRNLTVFADGEVDRSATGSGTSARLALLHHQGRIEPGQMLHNHSIVGTVMTGTISKTTPVDHYEAVVSHVGGQAHLMGMHTFVLQPDDPLGTGFLLR